MKVPVEPLARKLLKDIYNAMEPSIGSDPLGLKEEMLAYAKKHEIRYPGLAMLMLHVIWEKPAAEIVDLFDSHPHPSLHGNFSLALSQFVASFKAMREDDLIQEWSRALRPRIAKWYSRLPGPEEPSALRMKARFIRWCRAHGLPDFAIVYFYLAHVQWLSAEEFAHVYNESSMLKGKLPLAMRHVSNMLLNLPSEAFDTDGM